jgi:hypothetical protein
MPPERRGEESEPGAHRRLSKRRRRREGEERRRGRVPTASFNRDTNIFYMYAKLHYSPTA